MADFKRHVTCSSATGVVVGAAAYACGVPPATCLVAAGLCGLAGMLPDVDSDSSKSFKTCLHIAAVIGAMLTIQGSRMFRIDHDWGIFAASCVFFFILYVVGDMIRKLTVHRGMIHSLPAAVIAGQFMYLVSEGDTVARIVKALALTAGFLSHLILDEVYSIDSTGKEFKIKKSFGTALKMIDYKHRSITAAFYAAALFLGWIIANESMLAGGLGIREMVANQVSAKLSEPSVAAESSEAASVNRLLSRQRPESAENALFRQRRRLRTEMPEAVAAVETTAAPSSLPEQPMLYRKDGTRNESGTPQRFGSNIPLPQKRGPAVIALTER